MDLNYINSKISYVLLNLQKNVIDVGEAANLLFSLINDKNINDSFSANDVDLAYVIGVFNVTGIDGVQREIQRLQSLGKRPCDIILGGKIDQSV